METAAIVTTTASRSIAHIHDRMPVIVAPEAFDFWLDPNVDAEMAAAVIQPARMHCWNAYRGFERGEPHRERCAGFDGAAARSRMGEAEAAPKPKRGEEGKRSGEEGRRAGESLV